MTGPLIVDTYEPEGQKDWAAFARAGAPWTSAVMKLSEGATYQSGSWYEVARDNFVRAAGARLGVDLFRGDFHYLSLRINGVVQANYAHARLLRAGGLHRGMLPLWLDVEAGNVDANVPRGMTRAWLEDTVNQFAERWSGLTGKAPMLYGGELLRRMGVRDRMGCSHSIVALYGPELHGKGESTAAFLARTGTDLDHLFAWQYTPAGAKTATLIDRGTGKPYPASAPGCGSMDISVVTLPIGDQLAAIRELCYDGPIRSSVPSVVSG